MNEGKNDNNYRDDFIREFGKKIEYQGEIKKNVHQKMKKFYDEKKIESVFDGFFNSSDPNISFNDFIFGIDNFSLIDENLNFDEEAKILNKKPMDLWRNFYDWQIDDYVKNRLKKTDALKAELEDIKTKVICSGEEFTKSESFLRNIFLKTEKFELNSLPESYLNLQNKIIELQRENKGEVWEGFDSEVVGLGYFLAEKKNDLSPHKQSDGYTVRILNQNKIFEYWGNVSSLNDVVEELSLTLIQERIKNNYRNRKNLNETRREVLNVLSENVLGKNMSQKGFLGIDNEKVSSLFEKGKEMLDIIRKVKEHDLMGIKISENLAELLKNKKLGEIEYIGDFFDEVKGKQKIKEQIQNKKQNNFKENINSRLGFEEGRMNWRLSIKEWKRLRDELEGYKNNELFNSIKRKMKIRSELDAIKAGIINNTKPEIYYDGKNNKDKKEFDVRFFFDAEGELVVDIFVKDKQKFPNEKERSKAEIKLKNESQEKTEKVQGLIDSLNLTSNELDIFRNDRKNMSIDEIIEEIIEKRKSKYGLTEEEAEILLRMRDLKEVIIPELNRKIEKGKILYRS